MLSGMSRWLKSALVLSLGLLVAIAASCSKGGPPAKEEAKPPVPANFDASTLVIARDLPQTIDPAIANDVASAVPMRGIYETLVGYKGSKTDELEPVLAEEWQVSPDGLTYTFKLRKNVKFHDGTDFNADAVKYSFDRVMKINQGPADIFKPVKEIKVLDPYTVQIVLKYPFAPFLYTLASQVGPLIVSPSAVKAHEVNGDLGQKWLRDHEAGTGPYKLAEWVPEQQITLARFEEYWKGWSGKHVDKIVIKNIVEPATARMLLEKGDVDAAQFVSQDDYPAFKQNPDIDLKVNPSLNTLYVILNVSKGPLKDKRVRQAVALAFDYQSVLNDVLMGYGRELRGVLPSTLWGFAEDLPPNSFDLEKAKTLLKEAGVPAGTTLRYLYVTGDEYERRVGEVLQAGLSQLGIKLEVVPMTWSTLYAAISNRDTAPDMYGFYWFPRVADPDNWLYIMFHSSSQGARGYNCGYYANPNVDKLLDDARRITDQAKRADLYKQVQRIISQDFALIPVAQLDYVIPMRAWVKGYVFNPMYIDTFNYYDMYKEASK